MLTFLLLGGFYIRLFPSWLRWTRYTSPTYYSYDILANSQFTSDTFFLCSQSGVSQFESCQNGAEFLNGREVVLSQNLGTIPGIYIIYLLCFFVGFRIIGYFTVLFTG